MVLVHGTNCTKYGTDDPILTKEMRVNRDIEYCYKNIIIIIIIITSLRSTNQV